MYTTCTCIYIKIMINKRASDISKECKQKLEFSTINTYDTTFTATNYIHTK